MEHIQSDVSLVNNYYNRVNSLADELTGNPFPVEMNSNVPVSIDFVEVINENQSVLSAFQESMRTEASNIQFIGDAFEQQDAMLLVDNALSEGDIDNGN